MFYNPRSVPISEALKILESRGVSAPQEELLQALCDGTMHATGLIAAQTPSLGAGTGRICQHWWSHINSPLDNAVWFDPAQTVPPTPFRAESITVQKAAIDSIWPEQPASGSTAPLPPAKMQDSKTRPEVNTAQPARKPRGPSPVKRKQVVQAMMAKIKSGSTTVDQLRGEKEEALAAQYHVSRDTARKARAEVLTQSHG